MAIRSDHAAQTAVLEEENRERILSRFLLVFFFSAVDATTIAIDILLNVLFPL
jgi:hypothetical protein